MAQSGDRSGWEERCFQPVCDLSPIVDAKTTKFTTSWNIKQTARENARELAEEHILGANGDKTNHDRRIRFTM